jgi:transcriptional regulator with XRE-family HTH domain
MDDEADMPEKKKKKKQPTFKLQMNQETLVKYRTIKGWKQEELAQESRKNKTPVSVSTISRAERGEPISKKAALYIAKTLGVTILHLVNDFPAEALKPPPSANNKVRVRLYAFIDVEESIASALIREPVALNYFMICKLEGLVNDGAISFTAALGSIVFSAFISVEDCVGLYKAFHSGELAFLHTSAIKITRRPKRKLPEDFLRKTDALLQRNRHLSDADRADLQRRIIEILSH